MFFVVLMQAQTPFERVYTILNTKCQNAGCHSATSVNDGPKFDGNQNSVYSSIFNVPSSLYSSSVAKHEQLVKPEHPYTSFMLRKIAGASFDTDLALDANEGNVMKDTSGNALSNTEIEFVRQWIRYGALQTYGSSDPQPDYATINQYYTDTNSKPFLPKPPKPDPGTGFQFRMGPVFLPVSGATEQEWLEQQEVDFPFEAEVYKITGNMNSQSHHFLLFKYVDSAHAQSPTAVNSGDAVAPDSKNMAQITPSLLGVLGQSSFDGEKNLTGAWQEDADLNLPDGTALMWEQKTFLDMNFHVKNYNATGVLPCDFYLNVYFRPRSASTIPMESHLVNNPFLGTIRGCLTLPPQTLPNGSTYVGNYNDGDNNTYLQTRYMWMAAGHTHKYGTGFNILVRDTFGNISSDTVYNGVVDYANGDAPLPRWDHSHPPLRYWNNGLYPVIFGGSNKAGLVANTSWLSQEDCIHFGFTTSDEMQLFYYMYTRSLPATSGINEVKAPSIPFEVYPNPMNGNGKMAYVLSKDSRVEASILDVTGKTIAQLTSENEQQGAHEITMTGNQKFAKGIYFARLVVDGVAYNRKFVVTE